MKHYMTYRCPPALFLIVAFLLLPAARVWAEEPAPAGAGRLIPKQLTPTLDIDDVRIGMKGYGLTVFAGTKIEPFAVEVVAVVPNDSPQRGTIWIICDEPRLDVSGPVQGMSGSPIFLWSEGEAQEIGSGGKLIGAFAFGFSQVEVCLAGVQPIAYMREVATRAANAEIEDKPQARRPIPGLAVTTLSQLNIMADRSGLAPHDRFRIDLASQILQQFSGDANASAQLPAARVPRLPLSPGYDGQPLQLSLPMSVGSGDAADALAPLFEGTGILPVAGAATIAGKPSHGIDVNTPLAPGSVLAIPLAFGDADLSATGTVTEILPDGTVIGFGHPMFGSGDSAVPMASGYVHFVVPRNSISFKRAGSLKLLGSIVRDEAAAVAGVDGKTYSTLPMTMSVQHNDREPIKYSFEIVDHESLLTGLVGATFLMASTAVHTPHPRSTLRMTGSVTFEGGRKINLSTTAASSYPQAALADLIPAITLAIQNPIEPISVEAIDLALVITDGADMLTIQSARLLTPRPRPGETVKVRVTMRQFEGPLIEKTIELPLPPDLKPGEYSVTLGGSNSYAGRLVSSRPYLFDVRDKRDMLGAIETLMSVDRESLYAMMPRNEQALSVGRQNLMGLPPSKAALVGKSFGGEVAMYAPMIETIVPVNAVVTGETSVTVTVLAPNDGN